MHTLYKYVIRKFHLARFGIIYIIDGLNNDNFTIALSFSYKSYY